jgi:hypothetical protein
MATVRNFEVISDKLKADTICTEVKSSSPKEKNDNNNNNNNNNIVNLGAGIAQSIQRIVHGLDGQGSIPYMAEILLLTATSRPALGPIQPPTHWE